MEHIPAEVLKEALYLPIEKMLDNTYQKSIALGNILLELSNSDITELNVNGEIVPVANVFHELLKVSTTFPFYTEEEEKLFSEFVDYTYNIIFTGQNHINSDKLNELFEINTYYTNTFWKDLEVWKAFEIIELMTKDNVIPYYEDIILDKVKNQEIALNEMSGSSNTTLIKSNNLAKIDTTAFIMSSILLNPQDKKGLADFYFNEDLNKREDKERYIDIVWNTFKETN